MAVPASKDGRPATVYATRCPICEKVYTTAQESATDRRTRWLAHMRWHHSSGRRLRELSMLADEMARTERAMGTI